MHLVEGERIQHCVATADLWRGGVRERVDGHGVEEF